VCTTLHLRKTLAEWEALLEGDLAEVTVKVSIGEAPKSMADAMHRMFDAPVSFRPDAPLVRRMISELKGQLAEHAEAIKKHHQAYAKEIGS
jgi:hypothetical protein